MVQWLPLGFFQLYLNNLPFITLYMSFKFPGCRGWQRARWDCSSETALLAFSNLETISCSSEQKLWREMWAKSKPSRWSPRSVSLVVAATRTNKPGVTQTRLLRLLRRWRGRLPGPARTEGKRKAGATCSWNLQMLSTCKALFKSGMKKAVGWNQSLE